MFVVKWRCPSTRETYRAHDARAEGRVYPTREAAEAVLRKFQQTNRANEFWVEPLHTGDETP